MYLHHDYADPRKRILMSEEQRHPCFGKTHASQPGSTSSDPVLKLIIISESFIH